MSQTASTTLTTPAQGDARRAPLIAAIVVLSLLTLFFWDFVSRQVHWAIEEQADWGHTLVIPFLSGYFVWLNRARLLAQPFRTTWSGFVPILLGLGIYTLSTVGPQVLFHHNLQGFGMAVALFGVALLFCGFRAMRWLIFPIIYLFLFGQTISYRLLANLTFELQDITARGSYWVLYFFGLDIEIEGNTLLLYDSSGDLKPLNIAEACSGMRMLMAFLALGVAMAYTGLNRAWQRVTLVALGIPTAIAVNILRVVTLSLLALVDSDFAAGDFHSFIGLIWLFPAFLIFLGIMWIIRNIVVDADPPTTTKPA